MAAMSIKEGKCVRCGYELMGLPDEGSCPECGQRYNLRTGLGTHSEVPGERIDRILGRARTISLALLSIAFVACGGLLSQYTNPRMFACGIAFGVVTGMATLLSYLNELERHQPPPSEFKLPPVHDLQRRKQRDE